MKNYDRTRRQSSLATTDRVLGTDAARIRARMLKKILQQVDRKGKTNIWNIQKLWQKVLNQHSYWQVIWNGLFRVLAAVDCYGK